MKTFYWISCIWRDSTEMGKPFDWIYIFVRPNPVNFCSRTDYWQEGLYVNIDWYTFMILHLCRTLMQIDHQTKSETEMDWIWSVAFDWISVPTCGKDLGLALGRQANQLFVTPCSKYSNVTDQTSAFLLTLINPGTMLMPVYIACISLKMFCQLFHRHS